MYFGQFLSPLVLNAIGRLAGRPLGPNQFIYAFSGITAVAAAFVFLFKAFQGRTVSEEKR